MRLKIDANLLKDFRKRMDINGLGDNDEDLQVNVEGALVVAESILEAILDKFNATSREELLVVLSEKDINIVAYDSISNMIEILKAFEQELKP